MKLILLFAAALAAGLAQAATITDVRVSGAGPVTFGQVFAAGDLKKSDVLVGAIGTTAVPLQVDVKATHADGSVRHAIISAQVPKAGTMQLNTGGIPALAGTVPTDLPAVVASATIGGIKYSASPSGAFKAFWLQGPIVNEWQSAVPLTTAAGVVHPHLTARFAIRYYTASKKSRVDVTIENAWAYEPGPQNFTYDADISIGGKSVYSKAGLTHYHHARWHRLFWWGSDAPAVNVQANTNYLIASYAVPNYDQSVAPSSAVLASLGAPFVAPVEPMALGLSNFYMPMTGANDGIGILPMWSAAYVLSMDSRARDATIGTADGAGSYSMHYRDRKTDRPVTLTDHPRMTVAGRSSDAGADAFPACGGDCATPYTHDIPHQPSMAYLPYLMTGDYYYLEEMQFWALYDAFASNPGYRAAEQGLVQSEQLRGQAWALRTLAQAAFLTPDADPIKGELTRIVNANLDWYNATYSNNPNANKLGVLVNGYAIDYANQTSMAPWMDDFFTSAVGYAVGLGFEKAKPLLTWKAKFTVGRMTAPGLCWVTGAPYSLTVRDTSSSPIYDTLAQSYKKDLGADFLALPCAGKEMAAAWGAIASYGGIAVLGDMANISNGNLGYPSNMQPALAYAVDGDAPSAKAAWTLFMNRAIKPDYSLGAQFNIIPRVAAAPPVIVPPAPPKAAKVTTGSNTKLAKQAGLTVVFLDPVKLSLVKSFTGVTATSKGAFTVSDILLQPGAQYLVAVISSAGKPLDAFLLTVPK